MRYFHPRDDLSAIPKQQQKFVFQLLSQGYHGNVEKPDDSHFDWSLETFASKWLLLQDR